MQKFTISSPCASRLFLYIYLENGQGKMITMTFAWLLMMFESGGEEMLIVVRLVETFLDRQE